jgi:hypothetical protein
MKLVTWDSSVNIVIGYRLDGWGSVPGRGKRFFCTSSVETGSGVHPSSSPVGGLSPVVKQLGHEADYSPPSSVEVKNGDAILPLPRTSLWHGT